MLIVEANGAEPEEQPALPGVAGNPKAVSSIHDELGVALPQGLSKWPAQLVCPLSATHAVHAVAERLAGSKVAEHLLELLQRRGFQRDGLAMWAFSMCCKAGCKPWRASARHA